MQPRPHFSKEGNTFVSRWSGASGDKKREPEKKEENQKEIWLEKSILETRNTSRASKSSVQLKDFKIVILNKQI